MPDSPYALLKHRTTLQVTQQGLNNICRLTDVSWRGLNSRHHVVQWNNRK